MMFKQPISLALVAAEHLFFGLHHTGYIDNCARLYLGSEFVFAVRWVKII